MSSSTVRMFSFFMALILILTAIIENNRRNAHRILAVTNKVTVHFYKPDNWQTAYIYYYNGAVTGPVRPGMEMTQEEGNWYSFTIVDWSSADIFFNNGDGEQIPADGEVALRVSGEVWYKDGVLYSEKPEDS
ncbi:MAG: starch-binding protein [Clostridiales bacterium]|nr:starch-binding protein [Clostridiales bacterium]